MEVKTFLIIFEKSLIANGFSSESARHHTLRVAKSLKDADKIRIHTMQNDSGIKNLADNYSKRIKDLASGDNKEKVPTRTGTTNGKPNKDSIDNRRTISAPPAPPAKKELALKTPKDNRIKKTAHASTQKIDVIKTKNKKVELTPEGRSKYIKWMFTNGLGTGVLLVLSSIAIIIVYALIAILISALVLVLVALAALGCIATLAGLIYGLIKLFSVVPEGVYEIGLALVILAVTLAASIGIYNLAVRIVPILWKRFTEFIRDKKDKLRTKLNKVRTECNGNETDV